MRAVEVVLVIGWVAFTAYWLAAAFTVKRGRMQWSAQVRIRVVMLALTILLVRVGAFRGHRVDAAPWQAAVGLALFACGLAIAIWARVTIGRNWGTPMTQKDELQLVTSGPYRVVRHPIYTGFLLAGAGTAIALNWIWLTAVGLAGLFFLYSAIVEERFLSTRFPDDYPAYRHSTKMLVPYVL